MIAKNTKSVIQLLFGLALGLLLVSSLMFRSYYVGNPHFSELRSIDLNRVERVEDSRVWQSQSNWERRVEIWPRGWTLPVIYWEGRPNYSQVKEVLTSEIRLPDRSHITIWFFERRGLFGERWFELWQVSKDGELVLSYDELFTWWEQSNLQILWMGVVVLAVATILVVWGILTIRKEPEL